jgi:4-hydroxy-tetrahydrodipicolinate reductase
MMGTDKIRIGINGAAGRMGKRLVALGTEDPELSVVAALEHADHPDLGKDSGVIAGLGDIGVPLASGLQFDLDAVIDFSIPEGADAILEHCLAQSVPLVLATTGLADDFGDRLKDAAIRIPIVHAPNMSLAVNLTMKLATIAAEALKDYGPGADVEILERHHRFKEDSPSGTALKFGELIADVMGQDVQAHGRSGRPGARPHNEIGYHAIRTGDNPGEHTIVFGMMGETVELTVRATNRDCYALGALQAAKFAAKQQPGLYSMFDVLGM